MELEFFFISHEEEIIRISLYPYVDGREDTEHAKSSLEPPPWILVAQPLILCHAYQPSISLAIVPLSVLRSQHCPQRPHDQDVGAQITQREPMSEKVPRSIGGSIELRAEDGAEYPDGYLHCVCRGTFGLTADVVRGPSNYNGDGGVDSACCEDGTDVGYSRPCLGQQDDVSYNGKTGGGHDEGRSELQTFRQDGRCEGQSERRRRTVER